MATMASLQTVIALVCLGAACLFDGGRANAKTVEQVIKLPVAVTDTSGQVVSHRIKVTIFRADSRARSPFEYRKFKSICAPFPPPPAPESSTEFYQQLQAGQTSDDMDYVEWASLIQMADNLKKRLRLLTDEADA